MVKLSIRHQCLTKNDGFQSLMAFIHSTFFHKEFHVFPDPDLLQATAYLHPSMAVMQRMPLLAFAVEGLGGSNSGP